MKTGIYLLAVGLLSGCASMSTQECLNADWQLIGFEDGSAGRALASVGDHRKACAKVNVTPDLARYESGHAKGAQLYCTAENGFVLGDQGGSYNGVCAKASERRFLEAFHAGQNRYQARSEVNNLVKVLDQHHERLHAIDEDILFHEEEIIHADSTPEKRAEHLTTLKELQQEKQDLAVTIEIAKDDLQALQVELDALIRRQQAMGYR